MAADIDWQEKIGMQISPVKPQHRCVVSSAVRAAGGEAGLAWGSRRPGQAASCAQGWDTQEEERLFLLSSLAGRTFPSGE